MEDALTGFPFSSLLGHLALFSISNEGTEQFLVAKKKTWTGMEAQTK